MRLLRIETKERGMARAKGEFDVKRSAQPGCEMGDGIEAAHWRFDKRFHGDLDATSVVHMLAVGTDVPGSAAYVAIERLVASLGGRTGTFFLQHSGTMTRGAPSLAVTVVPDSGTDELAGLAGSMTIDIAEAKHYYTFDYDLPESA